MTLGSTGYISIEELEASPDRVLESFINGELKYQFRGILCKNEKIIFQNVKIFIYTMSPIGRQHRSGNLEENQQ